ncbi:MAG TPA: MarR family transcriptional regulator [Acidimicrobiales bacterium]|nr:MarR family transcriptional regulator [Acidimicrobiales bacterium]
MSPSRPLRFDPILEARRQWEEHGWKEAAPGMAAITSVTRAHQVFMARVDAVLRPFELSFARYELLMVLLFSRRGSLPLNKLGSRLQVHPTSVTNAVDRLEQQGMLRRMAHPTDGRTTLAEITPAGRRVARRATDALNAGVFSVPGLEAGEVESLVGILTRLREGAGDFRVAGPEGQAG